MSNFVDTNLSGLWAITSEALGNLSDRMNLAQQQWAASPNAPIEAASGKTSGSKTERPYTLSGSVAIVPVSGALSKNGLEFLGMTFLTSMRGIAATLRQAEADPAVRAIMLDVDSPGGSVNGIEELAEAVAAVGASKPLYAYADGLMASAAYWLSCAAREIAAPPTASVGSIGVVMMQRDVSKALEGMGIKYNIITAGHYKAAGNAVQPLSDEMRAYLQSGIDHVYELFLQAVEQGRDVSREKALGMADGKVFMAGEALKAGLVDRVCSKEAFINHIKETLHMTLAELKAQHPEAVKALQAELEAAAVDAHAAAQDSARTEGGKAEQNRIMALAKAVMGENAVSQLEQLVASGVTPEQAASLRTLFTETAAKEAKADSQQHALDALKAAAVAAPLTPSAALGETADAKADFTALVEAHMDKKGCSRGVAIQAMAAEHPAEHEAWIASQQKGGK